MCARALPGGNEVLGQVDADRCSCDHDMAVARPVQLAADLYLRSRHLPDLVDLSALAADDRADQLRENRGRDGWVSVMEKDERWCRWTWRGQNSITSFDCVQLFLPLLTVVCERFSGKKKKKKRGWNVRAVESTLMRTTSNFPITLSSVDWSSIMHVKSTFFPPRVPPLIASCACTGKRDERRHICLSLIWVAKRLLIPQSGDDFPNKSLSQTHASQMHLRANGKHNGKITQIHNIPVPSAWAFPLLESRLDSDTSFYYVTKYIITFCCAFITQPGPPHPHCLLESRDI